MSQIDRPAPMIPAPPSSAISSKSPRTITATPASVVSTGSQTRTKVSTRGMMPGTPPQRPRL
jgi:hypothetical protein